MWSWPAQRHDGKCVYVVSACMWYACIRTHAHTHTHVCDPGLPNGMMVSVCMYVCVCLLVGVYVYVCGCVCGMHMYIYIHICMHKYIHICINNICNATGQTGELDALTHAHTRTHTRTHTHTHAHTRTETYIHPTTCTNAQVSDNIYNGTGQTAVRHVNWTPVPGQEGLLFQACFSAASVYMPQMCT
jgi:hypothetical protein